MSQTTEETEADVRRDLIVDLISETVEPVTAYEVAHAIGVEVSTVRKDMHLLLTQKRLFAREETPAERRIRFDGPARASRACLYSTRSPVPPRTSRVAVGGYVAEQASVDRQMTSHEVNARLANVFGRRSDKWRFTSESLSSFSGVTRGTIHARLRGLEQLGFIQHVGWKDGGKQYKVTDKRGVLSSLGVKYSATSTPPPPPVPEPQAEMTVERLQTLALEVLEENKRLRTEVASLREQVVALTTPQVDPEVAKALGEWRPSA